MSASISHKTKREKLLEERKKALETLAALTVAKNSTPRRIRERENVGEGSSSSSVDKGNPKMETENQEVEDTAPIAAAAAAALLTNVTFRQQPLEDAARMIRLLLLLPSYSDRAIRLRSSSHFLDEAPPYNAISYTWGPPDESTIVVDDLPLRVRKNCQYALWQLRLHQPGEYVWIDSICINQHSIYEKNCQVAMMDRIYGKAKRVFSCIGPHADNSEQVCKAAADVGSMQVPGGYESYGPYMHMIGHLAEHWADSWGSHCMDALLDGLESLCNRPYWGRLWVVQEVLAGTGQDLFACDNTVLCGEDATLLRGLRGIFSCYYRGSEEDTLLFGNLSRIGGSILTPYWFFNRAKNFHCTDSRDRVYGLLGLANLSKDFPAVQPDYNKSSWEIFLELAPDLIPKTIADAMEVLEVGIDQGDLEGLIDTRLLHRSLAVESSTATLSQRAHQLLKLSEGPRYVPLQHRDNLCPVAATVDENQLLSVDQLDLSHRQAYMAVVKDLTEARRSPGAFHLEPHLPLAIVNDSRLVAVVDHRAQPGDLILSAWDNFLMAVRPRQDDKFDFVGHVAAFDQKDREAEIGYASDWSTLGWASHWSTSQDFFKALDTGRNLFYVSQARALLSVEDQLVYAALESRSKAARLLGLALQLVAHPEGAIKLHLKPYRAQFSRSSDFCFQGYARRGNCHPGCECRKPTGRQTEFTYAEHFAPLSPVQSRHV